MVICMPNMLPFHSVKRSIQLIWWRLLINTRCIFFLSTKILLLSFVGCHIADVGSFCDWWRQGKQLPLSSIFDRNGCLPAWPSSSESSPSLPGSHSSPSSSDETIQFMMVIPYSESYEDWLQHRAAFLQR